MLKIRLRRVGKRKQPGYRIVVAESTSPRDGRFVEIIGTYNPRTEPESVKIEEARALYWLKVGAQPTESVARIFTTHGTMGRFERLRAGESLEALVAEAEAGVSALEETAEASEEEAEAEVEAVEEAEPSEEDVEVTEEPEELEEDETPTEEEAEEITEPDDEEAEPEGAESAEEESDEEA